MVRVTERFMDTGLQRAERAEKAERAETRDPFATHSKVVFPEVGVKVPLRRGLDPRRLLPVKCLSLVT